MKKTKVAKKKVVKEVKAKYDGLEQTFISNAGKKYALKNVLKDGDWWELKSRGKVSYILTHDAVKKLADIAGISSEVDYSILTQPSYENNYQQTWQAKVRDAFIPTTPSMTVKVTTEIGEVNRNNLGTRGKNNPANMAQKRAFDRAVLRHLGIVGFLGEDELPDRDEEKMDTLDPDEAKAIVGLLNEIFATKNQKELMAFSTKMVTVKEVEMLNEKQLGVLRNAWNNQSLKFSKSF